MNQSLGGPVPVNINGAMLKMGEEDLIDIWLYIAHDNMRAADGLLDDIEEKLLLLADQPGLGTARPDIAPDLRYFPVRRYLILYRQITDGIEVVRMLHGARDIPTLMADT